MLPPLRGHWALLSHPALTSATSSFRYPSIDSQFRTYASPSSTKTHKRPSTSAQPSSTSAVPSTSSTASTTLPHDVNPPPSTHPADLNLPDPVAADAPVADKAKRYVALGRAFLSFYKTGLKNVYNNYKSSVPLRRELGIPVYWPISPPPKKDAKATAFRKAMRDVDLSRSSFQLIHRAAYDVRRMVPFTLMLIVCGELTPLVVLALGSAVVPFTCRMPKQIFKDWTQKAARKRAALIAHHVQTTGFISLPHGHAKNHAEELDLLATQYINLDWIANAQPEEILRACAVLGLVRTHNRPSALVSSIYRPRLRRHAEYLQLDDGLIHAGGGVSALEAIEVRMAVEERGGVELLLEMEGWEAEREQRRWLEGWLERRM